MDDLTRKRWTYYSKRKNKAFSVSLLFVTMVDKFITLVFLIMTELPSSSF